MKLSQKEKETLEIIRNLTHENIERINNTLLGLMIHSLLNYTNGESVTIPYFGSFLIRYKGDVLTDDGKEAVLETFFDPSPYFRENIGCYEDFKKAKNKDLSTIPIIHLFETLNEQSLNMTLNADNTTED